MKKRLAAVLAGALACSMIFAGCSASKGLETDSLKITQYKDVEIDQIEKPAEITDEELESGIQEQLVANADVTDKNREVKKGDTAVIDFVGKMNGVEFEGGSGQDYPLEIGSGSFIEGFEDSIIGHKIGETFDWNGKFPKDYGNEELNGKDVVFTITVKGIVPELSDEFVQAVSKKSKTVDEYKKEMKEKLAKEAEENYQAQLGDSAWQAVIDNTEVSKYPEDELKKMNDDIISRYKEMAEQNNMEYDAFIEANTGADVETFENQVNEISKSSLMQTMVTKAIADKEKITLDDKTYEAQLDEIAAAYGYENADALKEAASEEDLKDIALNNLVKEWLSENCIQKAAE